MISRDLRTLTVPQVAEVLGIHPFRVYRLVKKNLLPVIRMGKSIRVREAALLSWMEHQEELVIKR